MSLLACTRIARVSRPALARVLKQESVQLLSFSRTSFFHSSSIVDARVKLSHTELDKKWSQIWQEKPPRFENPPKTSLPTCDAANPKFYSLSMFPYPSGMLHIGHLRVYTICDTISKYRRMRGYDVINPMGWDAFGLPAENAATERGIDPEVWTLDNIKKMKSTMDLMFADFDWEREVVTCLPEYYKHTQKLFLMMYNEGMAYRKEAIVNWDPVEQTVLANEQVDAEGKSWRSGALVEKKMLEQWFLKITDLAPELLNDLELLDNWPTRVKTMQKNWIGKSTGAKINFPLSCPATGSSETENKLVTFTTRPDTLYGVQYAAISLNHPLTRALAKTDKSLAQFLEDAKSLPEDTKQGYKLPDVFVANPLNPTKFDTPVFVAPYVLDTYGHGAVMGCPGHDLRDNAFWKENMPSEPIVTVVNPPASDADAKTENKSDIYTGKEGTLASNCGKYAGLSTAQGGKQMVEDLSKTGLVQFDTQWKLRDWLISRQRFWGAPIPIIHCDNCGTVPVPDSQLPVMLPKGLNGPLSTSPEFIKTECPSCGSEHARHDTDTMDTFMDSSWYLFRYTDPQNPDKIFDAEKASNLMPVDMYIGGVEHAILHLLYTRFVSKFLARNGSWNGGDLNGEPIRRLVTQGMVHGKTAVCPETGKFLKPEEFVYKNISSGEGDKGTLQPVIKETGKIANISFEKMSKSKYNGASPEDCIAKHGADATRAHILFQAPVTDVLNWEESQIVGVERWLAKVWNFTTAVVDKIKEQTETVADKEEVCNTVDSIFKKSINLDYNNLTKHEQKLWQNVQKTITSVTSSFHDSLSLNTVISDYMKLSNALVSSADDGFQKVSLPVAIYGLQQLLKMMAPVTPANAEENWKHLESVLSQQSESSPSTSSVFAQPWPLPVAIPGSDHTRFSIVIDGKRRFTLNLPKSLAGKQEELLSAIMKAEEGKEWLQGKELAKVVAPKGYAITIETKK